MNKTVLIIEDEIVLQDVYKLVLTHKGYVVHTANNGIEGVSLMKKIKPDLVLLDLFMPLMGGKDFLRNIDMHDYPNAKIIVCTNLSDRETEAEVLSLGAHKFILKSSMTPADLVQLASDTVGDPVG